MENIKTYDLNDAVINNKRTTYYNYRPNHCNRLTFAHLPYYAPWKIIIQASVFMHRYEWMNETSNFYSIYYLFICPYFSLQKYNKEIKDFLKVV